MLFSLLQSQDRLGADYQTINEPLKFFDALENQNLIHDGDTAYLKSLLEYVSRNDLIETGGELWEGETGGGQTGVPQPLPLGGTLLWQEGHHGQVERNVVDGEEGGGGFKEVN